MIRPFTCLCMLVAAGSGLYLYQEKHRAEMLDHEIGKVVKATDAAHERTGMLRAEWTLLNEPERLQDLAAKYLQLQPMAPTQFVQLAGLDARLPPVALPPPPAPEPTEVPMAAADLPPPVAVAAAATRPPGPPATADLGPAVAVAAPIRMAGLATPVATVAVTAKPAPARAADAHDAAPRDAAATRPAPREVAHTEPPARRRPAPQVANAGSFQPGPSAEPRALGSRQIMAPIVDAFATPHPVQINRPPVLQRTGAMSPVISSEMPVTGSVLGASALGGGRPMLAPPVPISR